MVVKAFYLVKLYSWPSLFLIRGPYFQLNNRREINFRTVGSVSILSNVCITEVIWAFYTIYYFSVSTAWFSKSYQVYILHRYDKFCSEQIHKLSYFVLSTHSGAIFLRYCWWSKSFLIKILNLHMFHCQRRSKHIDLLPALQ